MGRPYNDLSPQQAYAIYCNDDADYMFLDVSGKDNPQSELIKHTIRIPLEELETRYCDIKTKTSPVMVISERGLRSIKACEFLVTKGFFNMNNVSGGIEFWPGIKKRNQQSV
jgi:rhodanese-related sulfurtransferase